MKIAIIGIRGIPVIYSGYETFAGYLAEHLAENNQVYAYCRSPYIDGKRRSYKKIHLITIPTIKSKNFETFIHSLLSTIHSIIFVRPDVIYYLGVGNALFTFLPRLFGTKTFINVDGLDWKREKWGMVGRFYLRASQYLATVLPSVTITDSLYMEKYYLDHYGKKTVYIPYAFEEKLLTLGKNAEDNVLNKYRLARKKYFVWVGRIVPDNHLENLINAFNKLKTDFRCVFLGDDPYGSGYKNRILKMAKEDRRIVMTGFVDRKTVAILVRNAVCYVETKRSNGTHPSLIEGMGLCDNVVAYNIRANKYVIGNGSYLYKNKKQLLVLLKKIVKERGNSGSNQNDKDLFRKIFDFENILFRYTQILLNRF
ncbi:DUF1972 domain-containing protein [Patescibacteria group bacterium]|nr:DUF1972 domain-containing protein [Patescibacteria group bacterium]